MHPQTLASATMLLYIEGVFNLVRGQTLFLVGIAMFPAASVSGWYFSHPQSQYFAVGKITRDQVESYSARKGQDQAVSERWLAPNLSYDN